jgi:hypothetical protein
MLGGTGYFVRAGYIAWRQLTQKAEDMSGNFQHVCIHTTQPQSL